MPSSFARVTIRLTPRGGRNAVVGWEGEALRVRVSAAPEGGKANEAMLRTLAGALRIAPSRLSIASGAQSRTKSVVVEGMTEAEVRARLANVGG